MSITVEQIDAQTSLLKTQNAPSSKLTIDAFSPEWLGANKLINKVNTGRGQVYFFALESHDLVLRHYRRGGLVAKASKDRFIWRGINHTRVYQELSLLDFMHQSGLNVPIPVAGAVVHSGVFYTADIITRAIPNTRELHEILQSSALSESVWNQIGKQVRKMHDMHVCHTDINVKNILIDDAQKVFLIDFDKCNKREGDNWKPGNIERFKRSLHKQMARHEHYSFSDYDWQAFLSGYT